MELITTRELMEFLKVKRSTIYQLRAKGMPFIKIGRAIRFDKLEVIRWLKEQQAA